MWPFSNKKSVSKKRGKKQIITRGYAAADTGRLYQDWSAGNTSADTEIYSALVRLRNRARDLSRNNDYVSRFLNMVKTNVVGHKGVSLQVKSRLASGKLDRNANEIIETHWQSFCKKRNCTVTGQLSMIDLKKMIVAAVPRDGEILIRKVRMFPYSDYLFALQPIEADQLDHTMNVTLKNGNKIVMGVEKDKWGRPVAYHILRRHPGDSLHNDYRGNARERVPAGEIIHLFIQERVGQSRGVTWLATPAARCKMLDGYEEAELVASRTGASTMGIFVNPDAEEYIDVDDDDVDGPDTSNDVLFESEPGTFKQAPEGYDLKTFDPNHPNASFADFEKAVLRGIASGLNVSYVGLANDLEGVSYSSIRQGETADRDNWKMLQRWLIEHFCEDVFESWLYQFLSFGRSGLELGKFDQYNNPVWRPRGWQWVDPDKESKAVERDVGNHMKSIWATAAEKGDDLEEIFIENARAIELAEEYGLNLNVFNTKEVQDNADQNGTIAQEN